jgi:hypothetical protein
MASYQLSIEFDPRGQKSLQNANLSVSLIQGTLGGGGFLVVGAIFPSSQNYVLTWDDDFSVYVATEKVASQAVLTPVDTLAAAFGQKYQFQQEQITAVGTCSTAVAELCNGNQGTIIAGGLARSITLDGGTPPPVAPMTVDSIIYNGMATITDDASFVVAAIDSSTAPGTIIPASWMELPEASFSAGPGLQVNFLHTTSIKVRYNDTMSKFMRVG